MVARRACANAGTLSYDEQLQFYNRLRTHLPDIQLTVHILNSQSFEWNTVHVRRNATDVLKTLKLNDESTDAQTKTVLQILGRMRPQREHIASAAALIAAVNGRQFVEDLHNELVAAEVHSATASTLRTLARDVLKKKRHKKLFTKAFNKQTYNKKDSVHSRSLK